MSEVDAPRLRRRLLLLAALIVCLLGLAGIWSWSPLRQYLGVEQIVAVVLQLKQRVGPAAAIAGFAVASALAVPLVVLTLVAIVSFGPLAGAIYTLIGGFIGSAISFRIGRWLGGEAVRHLAGGRINAISARLRERGVFAAAALRLVPIAPFAVANMIAGASHIRMRDFLVGSTLGMIPGTVAMALFVDQFVAVAKDPEPVGMLFLVLVAVLIIGVARLARKWLA